MPLTLSTVFPLSRTAIASLSKPDPFAPPTPRPNALASWTAVRLHRFGSEGQEATPAALGRHTRLSERDVVPFFQCALNIEHLPLFIGRYDTARAEAFLFAPLASFCKLSPDSRLPRW
jgi:hypothetical protein